MGGARSEPRTAAIPLDDALASVEAAGMFPWQWDIPDDRVTWTDGIDELLGLPPGTQASTFSAYIEALHEPERAIVRDAVERSLSSVDADYAVEHRVFRPDGQVRWLAARGRVFRDATGKPVRMAGVVWDVTARKEGEASVERLQRLWAVVREVSSRILRGTSEPELFQSACRIAVDLGLYRFAWVGLVAGSVVEPVARFGHEDGYLDSVRIETSDTPLGRGPTGLAVREGSPCVIRDVAEDPRFAPWRDLALRRGYRACAAFPLRRGGRVVGALNVYADRLGFFDDEQVALLARLTDDLSYGLDLLDREAARRAAEEALRASEERYRAVFAQAFEGIVLVAPTHAIIGANESVCRMLGYTHEELLKLRAEDVLHADDLAAVPIRLSTIAPGGVILSERRFVRKDGTIMHGELSTRALLGGTFLVVIRDVTERKQAQAQMLLTDRMTSLGRLAAGVAHEVNNPLAYVMLNLELVAGRLGRVRPADDADVESLSTVRRAVEDARDGAERMRRIIRALSAFGRGDEERLGPVDVSTVLDSAIEIASMQLRHDARLVKEYAATAPARANPFRLGQVFVNLLLNAGDALPEGRDGNEIRLRTFVRLDGTVVVEIQDNGMGIPARVLPRIFDPFFTTKPVGKGTGLGLAVCHTIVTSFGGAIACESVEGRGAVFRVTLGAANGEEEEEPVPSSNVRAEGAPGRVLVVDDDAQVAGAMAASLEGHAVTIARGGREAIERFRAGSFDCVLCDVMMPEVSGLDVYEELKLDGQERRIVFVTGGAVSEAVRQALARVPNRVLEKPVDGAALRAAVDHAVARARR